MSTRGFTLIELLITVAVIAALAAISVPKYNKYKYKSRRAECFSIGSSLSRKASIVALRIDDSPARIVEAKSSTNIDQLEFPIDDVRANDNQTMYYSYNVGPGRISTANNALNWFPNSPSTNPNKLDKTFNPYGLQASRSYPNENFTITCAGRVTNQNETLDVIKIPSSSGVFLWSDSVENLNYPTGIQIR